MEKKTIFQRHRKLAKKKGEKIFQCQENLLHAERRKKSINVSCSLVELRLERVITEK